MNQLGAHAVADATASEVLTVSTKKEALTRQEKIYPWLFVVVLTLAEILVIYKLQTGMIVHLLLLAGLLISSALSYGKAISRFYITFTLAPLIRILSLSLPLAAFPPIYWYATISLPLLIGAALVARLNGYQAKDIGLSWGFIPFQLLISLIGIPLGIIEYLILRPQPLIPVPGLSQILLSALILLVCTGFVEEIIFRGLMQKAAVDFLGHVRAFILVGFIFAVLHITHVSFLDIVFVFGVAILFALLVYRTGSILGTTFAHGLTNIILYLIAPLYLKNIL